MTKPKILNGNNINPLLRLQKRLGVYRDHHNESQAICNKIQESHNKINFDLKVTLEKKSKNSDTKVKKKRTTNTVTVNRKKSKALSEKTQSKQFFDECLENNQNLSLNARSADFPDIDLDSFDILKDQNFSMSINEQELDGVLSNCCASGTIDNNLSNNRLTSSFDSRLETKTEPTPNMNSNYFKIDDGARTSLCPTDVTLNSHWSLNSTVDYASSLPYIAPNTANVNYSPNIVRTTKDIKSEINNYNTNVYSVNMNNNSQKNPSETSYNNYEFNPSLIDMYGDFPSNSSHQYFYQYSNTPSAPNYPDPLLNGGNKFQLPAMSTGWYNNHPTQSIKKLSLPQQQFNNVSSKSASNYETNIPFYQMNSQATTSHHHQYQPQFNSNYYSAFPNNSHSYNNHLAQPNLTGFNVVPDHMAYYYGNYSHLPPTNGKRVVTNSNSIVVNQNNSQLLTNNNINICRNAYPSHCM